MYHQCETVVRCAAGTSEPFAVEVGLHQGSAFSPFLYAIMMDSLTENIRKEAPWQMMFADDVVLCAREKDVLELELEQWREALEKRRMKVLRAKTEYMCLNGTSLGSVKMQSAQLPQVTEFKYLGSTMQSDGDMTTEINKRTQCGWNNWRKMSGVLCDKRVPSSSSSLGSRCVPWLGEGLSMSSPNDPVLCCPLPYRVAPVFVQVVSPPLGWSPLTSFLVIWSPSGDARGPSVVFEAVDMPCPGPFHFSHSVDYIYEFCPLPNPDVGPSIFVCDVEHTSFHFGLCGRKFVLCVFGQCPGLCTICHSWQHTGVVHLSLQADGKVAFEDIPVFGVCRPACHDSSLYLFVLVLFLEAVVLSQVHVAWDIFYQHIVHVYRGVVYNHHLCLCDVHLKTHLSTFIG